MSEEQLEELAQVLTRVLGKAVGIITRQLPYQVPEVSFNVILHDPTGRQAIVTSDGSDLGNAFGQQVAEWYPVLLRAERERAGSNG